MNLHRLACVLLGLGCLMLSGCVLALNSLGTEKDVVFKNELLGVWAEPLSGEDQKNAKTEQRESWSFTKRGENQYLLMIAKRGEKPTSDDFEAQLIELDKQLYLQIRIEKESFEKNYTKNAANLTEFFMIRGYFVYKVVKLNEKFQLTAWKIKELEDYLNANPKAVPYQVADDKCVLTGTTEELQAFFRDPKTAALWEEPGDSYMVKEK
jgi:hypothetical protein